MIRECLGATKVFAAICLLVPANASRADPAAERASALAVTVCAGD